MGQTTDLGKYLKKMRIDRDENMSDMATKLAVSQAFLSAVESGKRKMPTSMITKICDLYELSRDDRTTFFDAVGKTSDRVDIPLDSDMTDRNEIALSIATGLHNLSDDQIREIKEILTKGGNK